MLSRRFVHFSGTELGHPSRFRFIISETKESWLPVVSLGLSISVLSRPGLLLPCAQKGTPSPVRMGSRLGMEVGDLE